MIQKGSDGGGQLRVFSFGLVLGFWVHLAGFEWSVFGWVGLFGEFGFENALFPGAVFLDLVWLGLGLFWVYLG